MAHRRRSEIDCDLIAHVRRLVPDGTPDFAYRRAPRLRLRIGATGARSLASRGHGSRRGHGSAWTIRSPTGTQPARPPPHGSEPWAIQASRRRTEDATGRSVGPNRRKTGHRPASKVFVDFQNDVTTDDVALAHEEGYESLEHLKRYTTLGMGTDQGKTSNFAAAQLMAELRGIDLPAPASRHTGRRTHQSLLARSQDGTSARTSAQHAARRCMTGISRTARR